MNKKLEEYRLKIPVYTSERIEINKDNGMFQNNTSYQNVVDHYINKIRPYSGTAINLTRNKRNKTLQTRIDKLTYEIVEIGERNCIRVKFSAYKTNYADGFVQTVEKVELKQDDKIGSDNNYFLLYPRIFGSNSNSFSFQWLILIYEDPNKDAYDLIANTKLLLKKIFELKVVNVKLPYLQERLEKLKSIPELSVSTYSISNNEEEVAADLKPYLFETKLRKYDDQKFQNLPKKLGLSFLDVDKLKNGSFNKRVLKFLFGEKEYRITDESRNDGERFKQVIEEIFNYETILSDQELKTIYDKEFMIDKFSLVIAEYFKND